MQECHLNINELIEGIMTENLGLMYGNKITSELKSALDVFLPVSDIGSLLIQYSHAWGACIGHSTSIHKADFTMHEKSTDIILTYL